MINADKESGPLYTMASAATKSNPASPNKNVTFVQGEGGYISMVDNDDLTSSMQAQIVITSSNAGNGLIQPAGGNGQVLVRSKSLDDLNTLFCYSNQCPVSGQLDNNSNNNQMPSGLMVGQQNTSHYSSFNRIISDFSRFSIDPNTCSATPQLVLDSSGPSSHPPAQQLFPPDIALGFNSTTANNLKGMSYSSHEICNAGSNHQQSLNNSSTMNNTSLCDIDNVMKKISSLKV